LIAGHCDIRQDESYNDILGYRRARAVSISLSRHTSQKIFAEKIVVSFGKRIPVTNGDQEDSLKLSRRVELIIFVPIVVPAN
jgi:outer membrane protein OmpA-like peptidoglycan-associated protein